MSSLFGSAGKAIISGINTVSKLNSFSNNISLLINALDTYAQYQHYYNLSNEFGLQSQQYVTSLGSLNTATQSSINNLNKWYNTNYASLIETQNNVVGRDASYYASRGVELFGSAVMKMNEDFNKLEKAKSLLYDKYLNLSYEVNQNYQNKYRQLAYAKAYSEYQKKMVKWGSKMSLWKGSLKLLWGI